MDYLFKVKEHFLENKKLLERQLKETEQSRDDSPTARESHSDTSRDQLQKLALAIRENISEIDEFLKNIPENTEDKEKIDIWGYVELQMDEDDMKLVLVPEKMGGDKIGDMQLISVDTPLGKALIGKRRGQDFEFNERKVSLSKDA